MNETFGWDQGLEDLRKRFVSGLDARLSSLEESAQSENWKQVAALAHKLRGAAMGYGYRDLAEEAGDLEESALQGNKSAIAALIQTVTIFISRAKTELTPQET